MPIKITRRSWLSLPETLKLLREGLQPTGNIEDNLSDSAIADDRECARVLGEALRSGSVNARIWDGEFDLVVTAEMAAGVYFTINAECGYVSIGELPGSKFELAVHSPSLLHYLRAADETNPQRKQTSEDVAKCVDWLCDEIAPGKPRQTKKDLLERARVKHNIGPRKFEVAWNEAIERMGRHDLKRPGRPRKVEM